MSALDWAQCRVWGLGVGVEGLGLVRVEERLLSRLSAEEDYVWKQLLTNLLAGTCCTPKPLNPNPQFSQFSQTRAAGFKVDTRTSLLAQQENSHKNPTLRLSNYRERTRWSGRYAVRRRLAGSTNGSLRF